VTFQVFLAEKARADLDALPVKIADQILSDCTRLAKGFPMANELRNYKGIRRTSTGSGPETIG